MESDAARKPSTTIPPNADDQARQRTTYASFGDDGVTASTNAFGNLMQLTRYFGEGSKDPSGFFCAEFSTHAYASPYRAPERLGSLSSAFANRYSGSRLTVGNPNEGPVKAPHVLFVGNRWPRFDNETLDLPFSTQYVVSENTVYQINTIKLAEETRDKVPPEISLNIITRIRGLNFTKNDDGFEYIETEDETDSSTPDESSSEDSSDEESMYDSVVRRDKIDEVPANMNQADETSGNKERNCVVSSWTDRRPVGLEDKNVCLYVSPFVDDQPQQPRIRGKSLILTVDDSTWTKSLETGKLEVAVAYTLDLFLSKHSPSSLVSPVSTQHLTRAKRMLAMPPITLKLSDDSHLDFILWRNVEHILSVCSIPVRSHEPTPYGTAGKKVDGFSDDISPIALTCGDIAAHRISTKASFHAFRFLMLTMKLIKQRLGGQEEDKICIGAKQSCEHGDCEIYWRIRRVCQGHVKWLNRNWALINEAAEELPAPQRWVSGDARIEGKSRPWHPHDRRIDTAFQIIKVAEFGDSEEVHPPFGDIVHSWAKDLDQAKRGDKHVFPQTKEGAPDRFYFADHALIWWAIKSADDLDLSPELTFDHAEKAKGRLTTPETFQLNILRRFTTNNPVSKKQMLATSRSHLDTRFLLSAEDTTLFHAAEYGLLNKATTGSKIATWTNTEDCQKYHEDNDESEWTHPIQFAMALILASQNKSINSRAPAAMYQYARSVLMRSSSPNGLLAGMLDLSHKPVFFEEKNMQDSYWSATFEAPYILLKYPQPQGEAAGMRDAESLPAQPSLQAEPNFQDPIIAKMAGQLSHILSLLDSTIPPPEVPASKEALAMRRHIPFGESIDQSNIVMLFDDWLYNVPKFFSFCGGLSNVALRKFCGTRQSHLSATVIGQAFDIVCGSEARGNDEYYGGEERVKGIVSDVPETSASTNDPENGNQDQGAAKVAGSVQSNAELCKLLDVDRSRANAKKRLLQFFEANQTTALICYLASSEEEGLVGFFDRHAGYEKYIFDDAAPGLLNKWVTELHLSFYRILSRSNGDEEAMCGFPITDEIQFPSSEKDHRKNDKWVQRAVVSFRFDGDFFDRFWTCHFLEHDPGHSCSVTLDKLDVRLKSIGDHWKQRRVLELVLFDRILKLMIEATDTILQEARARVLQSLDSGSHEIGTGDGSNMFTAGHGTSPLADALNLLGAKNNDAFLSASTLCHKIQHLLQAVEDDLGKNLETIRTWSDREKERGLDRPRWTRKDEERYRGTISKWQASNKHMILELNRRRANIVSYNSSLARKLEDIRNELDLRGADDIRLFTYVTAVFLPIGFATSVFSMSDSPSGITLGSMIGTAVTALLLTLIALVNAKFLRKRIVTPAIHTCGAAFQATFNAIVGVTSKHGMIKMPSRGSVSSSTLLDQEATMEDKPRGRLFRSFRGAKERPPNNSVA